LKIILKAILILISAIFSLGLCLAIGWYWHPAQISLIVTGASGIVGVIGLHVSLALPSKNQMHHKTSKALIYKSWEIKRELSDELANFLWLGVILGGILVTTLSVLLNLYSGQFGNYDKVWGLMIIGGPSNLVHILISKTLFTLFKNKL